VNDILPVVLVLGAGAGLVYLIIQVDHWDRRRRPHMYPQAPVVPSIPDPAEPVAARQHLDIVETAATMYVWSFVGRGIGFLIALAVAAYFLWPR
jgi:hypothetical protein